MMRLNKWLMVVLATRSVEEEVENIEVFTVDEYLRGAQNTSDSFEVSETTLATNNDEFYAAMINDLGTNGELSKQEENDKMRLEIERNNCKSQHNARINA